MTASYRQRGAIGPPYMTSRHKRNHHDKTYQSHHQHSPHHRHSSLSFRSNDELEDKWRLEGRHLMLRHRRSVGADEKVVDESDLSLRIKRQSQGCTVDYNSYRRLRIGCSRQDVIDVNPSCTEEGDEGKYNCLVFHTEKKFISSNHLQN